MLVMVFPRHYETRSRAFENEHERGLQQQGYVPGPNQDQAYGGDIGPDPIIREDSMVSGT